MLNFEIFICAFVCILHIANGCTVCEITDLKFENAYLPNGEYKTIKPFGRRLCAKECNRTHYCLSINHNISEMECRLNVAKNGTDNQLITSNDWTYAELDKDYITCGNDVCSDNDICITTRTGMKKCVTEKCDSKITYNNAEYEQMNQSFGALADIPCAKDGYSGILGSHITYQCTSRGNWIPVNDACSAFIKVYTVLATWFEAKNTCIADNASLLYYHSAAFRDDVIQLIDEMMSGMEFNTSCGVSTNYFWVGANDIQEESVYRWVDDLTFSAWETSTLYVDDTSCGNIGADCLQLRTDNGKLSDRHCDGTFPFVCVKF